MGDQGIKGGKIIMRIFGAMGLVLLVLVLSSLLTIGLTGIPSQAGASAWKGPAATHLSMAAISLLLIISIGRKDRGRFGLKLAPGIALSKIITLSLAIAIPASAVAEIFNAGGHSPTEGFSILQIILLVILLGSICEEVLFRGLVQGFLSPLQTMGFGFLGFRISLPTAIAGVLFGLIHFTLLTVGVRIGAVLMIVISGIILGIIAGYYREKTESLIPAFLVHIFFNVGGTVAEYAIDMV